MGTKDRKSPWFQGVKNSNTTTTCSRSWSFPSFLGLSAGPLMYIYCLIHYIQTNFPSNSLLTSPLSSDQLFCFPTKNSRPSRNIIYHGLTSCNKLSYHSWKWQPSRKKKISITDKTVRNMFPLPLWETHQNTKLHNLRLRRRPSPDT